MRKLQYLLLFFAITLNYCDSQGNSTNKSELQFNKDVPLIEKLNNMQGKEKWDALRSCLLEYKKFMVPPSSEIEFNDNNILCSIGFRPGEANVKFKGSWSIDSRKRSIQLKVAKTEVLGFTEGLYQSFKVRKSIINNKNVYSILLYTGDSYITPEGAAYLHSEDYFYMRVLE